MDIGWKNQSGYSFSSCKAKSQTVLLPCFLCNKKERKKEKKALQWGQAIGQKEGGGGGGGGGGGV